MPHVMFGDIAAVRSSDRDLRDEPVLQMLELELEFAEPEQLAGLCKVISSLSSDELRSLLVEPQRGYGKRSEVIEILLAVRWMRLDPIGALGDACDCRIYSGSCWKRGLRSIQMLQLPMPGVPMYVFLRGLPS